MTTQGLTNTEFELKLVEECGEFYDDPLGWVMWAFPWGEAGTMLEKETGPDDWQRDQLESIREAIQADPEGYVIRDSTSSGHGIGKTCETAWIVLWAMSTRPHLNGVVTANTTAQLTTKTWRELALWHKLAINTHWFKWAATSFKHVEHPETWFVNAIPNTEYNSEAFAGLHAQHVLLIMDEASAIPDKIKEVAMGAMTTPRAMWFAYGNPTRNTGWFRETFYSESAQWKNRKVDSRTCKMVNRKEIEEWVKTYGEDSDFIRVRVRGEFPRAGNMQFINSDTVDHAMGYDLPYEAFYNMPIFLGCDVARYGEDKTIITLRAGRKLIEMRKFRELDTMAVARECVRAIKEFHPALVFVDGVGIGAGVVDRLRMLGYEIIDVNAGMRADDTETYYNKRAEMWDRMRKWLPGADIPADPDLRAALIGIEYGFSSTRGTGETLILEKKKDMKKRGLNSPDEGDSIALTFAELAGPLSKSSFEPGEDEGFEPQTGVL